MVRSDYLVLRKNPDSSTSLSTGRDFVNTSRYQNLTNTSASFLLLSAIFVSE